MLKDKSMDCFKRSLATLTGGSGAVAVLLTDGTLSTSKARRLVGGANRTAPRHHDLCRWGIEPVEFAGDRRFVQFTSTDAASVLTHGVELGKRTWQDFSRRLGWDHDHVHKVICHQVAQLIAKRCSSRSRSRNRKTFPHLRIWATWVPCRSHLRPPWLKIGHSWSTGIGWRSWGSGAGSTA